MGAWSERILTSQATPHTYSGSLSPALVLHHDREAMEVTMSVLTALYAVCENGPRARRLTLH